MLGDDTADMARIVVVGAGCFGSWTAWHLTASGHAVTLVDAYGPGNSRSSSGGESRVIRMGYGDSGIYTRWARQSLRQWQRMFAAAAPPLFHRTGVLWIARDHDRYMASTLQTLQAMGVPHQRLTRAQLETRWPQIDFHEIALGVLEPDSGVLLARRAVAAVADAAVRAGAQLVSASAGQPVGRGRLQAITLEPTGTIDADLFVFACGPWLPKVFPALLGDRMFITRQEVVYVGPPAGDARFAPPAMPAWIDFGSEMYGVPDIETRGFKIALDRHGAPFDPDQPRHPGSTFDEVRAYVARRFPPLAGSPIVAAEVCQYENTSNGDFIVDRHPSFENVWIVGGGSGHGFKHGPAVGEYVARLVDGSAEPEPRFALSTKEPVQQRSVF